MLFLIASKNDTIKKIILTKKTNFTAGQAEERADIDLSALFY
jgi:hypothetical protein